MRKFNVSTDHVLELIEWLKARTESVPDGIALLIATAVVASESHLKPRPSREDIVQWAADAIRGMKLETEHDTKGTTQLHGGPTVN